MDGADCGGAKLVRSIPSTASLYSSMVGVRPRMADSTTTGVEASNDSPFFSSESSTTRPKGEHEETASRVVLAALGGEPLLCQLEEARWRGAATAPPPREFLDGVYHGQRHLVQA